MKARFLFIFRSNRLINWLQHRLSPKQFVIFSAILIGLTAGFAAVLLKLFVHFVLKYVGLVSASEHLYIAIFPLIGIGLCVMFVHFFNRGKLGKGLACCPKTKPTHM